MNIGANINESIAIRFFELLSLLQNTLLINVRAKTNNVLKPVYCYYILYTILALII